MRKFIIVLLFHGVFVAKAQIGYEDYYSEEDLLTNLQKAKKPSDQLDATGVLAVHYKGLTKDSLAAIYLSKTYQIAKSSNDVRLLARAIWWDNRYEGDTSKANQLLQLAAQNNLLEEKIIAYGLLAEYYIHYKLQPAEKNALAAKALLENWKKDTTRKDSLKLVIYNTLAHVYIHKDDGVNASQYLLALQDYTNNKNESLKIQAINILGDMYFEWSPQKKKATDWMVKSYKHYKKEGNKNKLLAFSSSLGMHYHQLGDTIQAKLYLEETDKLIDSLKAYGHFQYYLAWTKLAMGNFNDEKFLQLIDNNFNGHLRLSAKEAARTKVQLFDDLNKDDSVLYYLSLYKKLAGDSVASRESWYNSMLESFYFKRKEYKKVIALLKEYKNHAEDKGDIGNIRSVYRRLYRSYSELKDYKNANEWLTKSYGLKDSLDILNNKEQVAVMQMQKQQDTREAAFNVEAARVAYRNKLRLYALFSGVLVLLVIAGILWRNNQRKQRDKLKIEQAYQQLKSTQQQLIQAEKMASLGELTAGIAHEIQNPLNFVNNFSEVNKELIGEMKTEIEKRNFNEVKIIARDIEANEEKINSHGKRADAIVKGMLQHSRVSSGQKEPTDLNALTDEYLRLAYHGLRAKDKLFNAKVKTDLDPAIGKISLVPQDIGRVILNLINNAFYAVSEKKASGSLPTGQAGSAGQQYEPTVVVTTKKLNGQVEMVVKDNGMGIRQDLVDKIFQPFFSTKPTGQGTGLGLSLAYDIVKAHGGEIRVDTKEGQGTDIIIHLPIH